MKKLPKPIRIGVFLLALALAGAAGYKLLVAPQRTKAAELAQEVDEARGQLAQAQAGPGAPADVGPIRIADLFRLSRAMPDKPDIPSVLLQLSEIASETGVTFQSITPHDPEAVGAYERVPIDLVFQGHFYDLSDFLYRLRNLVGVHDGELDAVGRLFSVGAVSFEEGDREFPQVRATLTVEAYVFGGVAQAVETPSAQPQAGTDTAEPSPTDGGDEPIPIAPEGVAAART